MSDEECLYPSKRRKIEETVSQILKTWDLETASELNVRTTASERLGLDLSGVPYRRFVRQLVESFLLSIATEILNAKSSHQNNDDNNVKQINDGIIVQHAKKQQQQLRGGEVQLRHNYNGKVICKLSEKTMVTTYGFNGTTMVSIGDFVIKDGNIFPKTGISLTPKQWSSFRSTFPSIEEAIAKLESQIRSEAAVKQSKADMTNSVADSAICNKQSEAGIFNFTSTIHPIEKRQTEADMSRSVIDSISQEHSLTERARKEAGTSGLISTSECQEHIPAERKLAESDISASASAFPSQVSAFHPKQLIPIQTTRLDGRNYHSWKHHVQLFLKQFNIAYVLVEPCPNVSLNSEISSEEKVKIKAAVQRWIYDDCICRDNILKSLCDSLFQWYSHKNYSAKELWEELKLVYDEDFGTKSSQINKYIYFQMVDGVSILNQVQELDKIANSIIASGTWIDESFHAGVIISKLPPSWKEFRYRLMHEDVLSFKVLLHRLQVEEESRNCNKKENTHKKGKGHTKLDKRFGLRKKENRRVCYSCGKEGHIVKFCPDRKFEAFEKSNEKENGVHSLHTGTYNMVETGNEK